MKALRHTVLLLLYVWVTVGMTVATHFCAGEPVSAQALGGAEQGAVCCCGEADDMEGCCSTSVTTVRVEDAHTAAAGSFFAVFQAEALQATADALPPFAPSLLPAEVVRPPGSFIPSHILACSLLI